MYGGRNDEPGFFRCKGFYPGIGGNPLALNDRIYMGGGGGGGHTNNNSGTPGGTGGGIIYVSANEINGNGRLISANGENAGTSTGDGAGGGGAGGTILLKVNSFTPTDLIVQASGGNGGNTNNLNENRCFGPGGGGAGGFVAINAEGFPNDVERIITGGLAGTTTNSTNGCNGFTNGATNGGPGTILTDAVMPEGTFTPVPTCNPLPVDFVNFTAVVQSDKVLLQWITASETNNDYFSIERSLDGEQFSEISRLSGKGTFTGFSHYQFIDNNPFTGISYYRLRQVDVDGKFAYSKTVAIENNPHELAVALYPNPVAENQSVFLQIVSPTAETIKIQIKTLLGESMFSSSQQVSAGLHTIELNTSGFPAGSYLVKVQSGNTTRILKLQVL